MPLERTCTRITCGLVNGRVYFSVPREEPRSLLTHRLRGWGRRCGFRPHSGRQRVSDARPRQRRRQAEHEKVCVLENRSTKVTSNSSVNLLIPATQLQVPLRLSQPSVSDSLITSSPVMPTELVPGRPLKGCGFKLNISRAPEPHPISPHLVDTRSVSRVLLRVVSNGLNPVSPADRLYLCRLHAEHAQ